MELRHDHHTVSMLTDHLVFNPKYRRKVLVDDIADETEIIICITAHKLGIKIIRMAVAPDHVHIFYEYPPKYSVSYIANRLKGASSRYLRQKFPELRDTVKEGALWSASCFHGSVGQGWDVVEAYIEQQKVSSHG
jgi:putative transposase